MLPMSSPEHSRLTGDSERTFQETTLIRKALIPSLPLPHTLCKPRSSRVPLGCSFTSLAAAMCLKTCLNHKASTALIIWIRWLGIEKMTIAIAQAA
ncbi:hypothetical protein QQF64_004707 [Cirrhinus molitorella]|uniref:Uncharacterized protein n=1 Tax=Cirrhinus molitorella TaxID=172907 RepID=A0ABR3MH00_9TELE